MITKPMLAVAVEDITTLKYPLLVTPKLDGIRCLILDGKALSRKFKEIPNHHVRKLLEQLPSGLDGEIMCPGKTFNETQSLIMTEEGTPVFEYHAFDFVDSKLPQPRGYTSRIMDLMGLTLHQSFVKLIIPTPATNPEELTALEETCLKKGYEGVMIRSITGPYKCGRSTLKEGYLLKLKRFKDSEAQVIGYEEKMHNDNQATKDELGHTKRSSHKANLRPANTLGTLLVRDMVSGIEFSIGTGFDDATRKQIWEHRDDYIGKLVNYTHQTSGAKDKPRFPSFRGFRDERDMS